MYRVVWTTKAEISYLNALKFTIKINESSSYANKIIDEVEKSEKLLIKSPFMGVQISDFYEKKLRKITILKNYSLLYRIYDDCNIHIIYFWDNRRNPKKLKTLLR